MPPYVKQWSELETPEKAAQHDEAWPDFPGVAEIGSPLRLSYFRSVEYEWRCLLDFLEKESSREVVVVILGDHQPRLDSNAPGEASMNTPVHVLSRDPAFVHRLVPHGFTLGLLPQPGGRTLAHEGMFSLWVSTLDEAYGEGTKRAAYQPEGPEILSGCARPTQKTNPPRPTATSSPPMASKSPSSTQRFTCGSSAPDGWRQMNLWTPCLARCVMPSRKSMSNSSGSATMRAYALHPKT